MRKSKNRNVYIFIITILFISLSLNIVGIILHVKNAYGYNYVSYQTNFETTTDAQRAVVYATLKDSDVGFVEGFGPREVSLSYGHTDVPIEVKNKNKTTKTYTLVINKPDKRSTENRLSDLTTNVKDLNFNSDQYSYNLNVGQNVSEISINATLKSAKSHFVDNYEPRKISLSEGLNVAFIRVKSEAGVERDYKLNIFKNNTTEDKLPDNSQSLDLSSLSLSNGTIKFKSTKQNYKVKVANDVEDITVYAFAKNPNAEVHVEGGQNLAIGKNGITVTVNYNNESKVYKIEVNRQKEDSSQNAQNLKDLSVGGFNLNFKPDKYEYELSADYNRNLIVSAYPYSNLSQVTISGNDSKAQTKEIKIIVTSEDNSSKTYTIKIKKQFWNMKNEIIAVSITFIVGLAIVALLKFYEMQTTAKKRQKGRKNK